MTMFRQTTKITEIKIQNSGPFRRSIYDTSIKFSLQKRFKELPILEVKLKLKLQTGYIGYNSWHDFLSIQVSSLSVDPSIVQVNVCREVVTIHIFTKNDKTQIIDISYSSK